MSEDLRTWKLIQLIIVQAQQHTQLTSWKFGAISLETFAIASLKFYQLEKS